MRCRVCYCTYEKACANGCDWARGEGDLCTNCAEVVEAIRHHREVVYWFSWARLRKEADQPLARAKRGKRGAVRERGGAPKHLELATNVKAKQKRGVA